MRAALSLLSLVIVAAIVLFIAKKQLGGLKPPAAASSAAAGAVADTRSSQGVLPNPKAVGQQVQSGIDEAARRNTEAASAVGSGSPY